jgi:hypothetical protein
VLVAETDDVPEAEVLDASEVAEANEPPFVVLESLLLEPSDTTPPNTDLGLTLESAFAAALL